MSQTFQHAVLRERLSETDALIFDFDGTLAPNLDLPDMKRQVIELTLTSGVPQSVFAGAFIVEIITAAHTWLASRDSKTAQVYFDQANALITNIELDAARSTRVFTAAEALLKGWRASGKHSAIVTRNCRAAVLQTFPQALTAVDALLARDDVQHLKPDVRHLESAVAALGAEQTRCMMVGDGAMDMQIGQACALFNVGVLSGSSDADTLYAAGADCVVPDIGHLLAALNGQ